MAGRQERAQLRAFRATFLLVVIVIGALLQYLPVLALGPIAEHHLSSYGQEF